MDGFLERASTNAGLSLNRNPLRNQCIPLVVLLLLLEEVAMVDNNKRVRCIYEMFRSDLLLGCECVMMCYKNIIAATSLSCVRERCELEKMRIRMSQDIFYTN